jgi:cobalt-zinc-cadmium efflux system protein
MPHEHDHSTHSHEPPNSNAAFAIGVVLNLGFVVAEVFYGLGAHSLALISDAGHNLSDVFCLLLAWGAMQLTKAAPTSRRTYGWRRSSIFAALINAVILLVVVGGIAVEAIRRLA